MRFYRLGAISLILAAAAAPAAAQETKAPPVAIVLGGPEVGQRAPDFRLPWASGDSIGSVDSDFVLRDHRGKTVVLAFYPRDFTSGCTAQMKAFTDRYAELFGEDVVVVGISADSLETHQRFAQSVGVPFKLLSDPTQRVAREYGSKGDEGFNRRTIYVIAPSGEIAYRNMRFGALDPKAYESLKQAVRSARES